MTTEHKQERERESLDSALEARDLLHEVSDLGVGVLLGIEEGASGGATSATEHTTHHDDSGLPGRPLGFSDLDGGLLRAVGEVVVSGAHVVKGAQAGHLHQPTVEAGSRCGIEQHAILIVLSDGSPVVVVLIEEVSIVEAVLLVNLCHPGSHSRVGEEGGG